MRISKGPCRYGEFRWYADDAPIGRSLAQYGEWAQCEIEFVKQFIRNDSVIADIGSNIGTHAVAFASFAPEGTVHAFEPNTDTYALLLENMKLATKGNIIPHQVALGADEGEGCINTYVHLEQFNSGQMALAPLEEDRENQEVVRVKKLDDFELSGVDFIKIDVEGFEADVIRGGTELIKRNQPVLLSEVNDIALGIDQVRLMVDLGYTAYLCSYPAFNPNNFRSVAENFFGVACESSLLFLPPGHAEVHAADDMQMHRVESMNDFASVFVSVPRFGDESSIDRNPAELLSRMKQTGEELIQSEAGRVAATNQLQEVEKELHEANSAIRKSASTIDEYAEVIEGLRIEVQDAKTAFAESLDAIAALEENLEREKSDLQVASEKLLAEHADFRAKGELWKKRINSLLLDRKALRIEVGECEAQLQAAYAEIGGLQHRSRLLEHGMVLMRRLMLPPLKDSLWGRMRRKLFGEGHALYRQWYRTISRSNEFDSNWYKQINPDVAEAGVDPIQHYLLWGVFEGRQPNPWFDSTKYLFDNGDVASSGLNPLFHFVQYGRKEKRVPVAVPERQEREQEPIFVPTMEDFDLLGRNENPAPIEVDVIIPVYKGMDDTLACIYSVIKARHEVHYEIVVINDCSPDPEMAELLSQLEKKQLISLVTNEKNLGFVGTVNKGMRMHPERDVLLLNSDTVVYGDWLDRLHAHAEKGSFVGSITPFSNNATICSYPVFNADNNQRNNITYEELDDLCKRLNAGQSTNIPTGIGFCMYIPRTALDAVGYFDEATFGKGYGEENDFCMRAAYSGYANWAALDVFVRHTGAVSFAGDSNGSKARGLAALLKKHPDYTNQISRFIRNDPMAYWRKRLDAGRLFESFAYPETVLIVTHTWGGGIDRYLDDRVERELKKGRNCAFMRPTDVERFRYSLEGPEEVWLPNLKDLQSDESIDDLLQILHVRVIEVHSTVGWNPRVLTFIGEISQRMGIPYEFFAHDYTCICPTINLIDKTGRYCGEVEDAHCKSCFAFNHKKIKRVHGVQFYDEVGSEISRWRDAYGHFFAGASRVAAPSQDTANRLMRYFEGMHVDVVPHEEELEPLPCAVPVTSERETIRVAVIGAIGPHKGANILLACAKQASAKKLPLHFVVVGYTCFDDQFAALENVTITGRYQESDVFRILEKQKCHIAFLPAVWPETFSYTLTIAIEAGFQTMVFDLGAPADRVRKTGSGTVLPLSMMTDASAINQALIELGRKQRAPAKGGR